MFMCMPPPMSIQTSIHNVYTHCLHTMFVHTSIHMSTYIPTPMSIQMSIYMPIHTSMPAHISTHVSTHVYTHAYAHVYAHVYIQVFRERLDFAVENSLPKKLEFGEKLVVLNKENVSLLISDCNRKCCSLCYRMLCRALHVAYRLHVAH